MKQIWVVSFLSIKYAKINTISKEIGDLSSDTLEMQGPITGHYAWLYAQEIRKSTKNFRYTQPYKIEVWTQKTWSQQHSDYSNQL